MSRQPDFLDNPSGWHGEIAGPETWWAERQEALERAGYMLRTRYRPGWKPSWVGTNKVAFDSEDGQSQLVSTLPLLRVLAFIIFQLRVCMDATRISDGRPVMLKRLLNKEGPYELQINKLFSTEPLSSNPRNCCAPLLDVIQLENEDPIMVHSLLRPFDNPPLRTYGEFVTFFTQICEVRYYFCAQVRSLILQGGAIHAFQPRCTPVHSPIRSPIALSADTLIGTVRGKISCSTRQICIPIRSTRLLWGEVKIFATRSGDIRGPGARQDISSSTWVFPVNMILLTGHLSTSLSMAVIGPHRNIKTARHHVTRFPPTCTTSEIWSVNIMYRYGHQPFSEIPS
jgi:hypothetical protein